MANMWTPPTSLAPSSSSSSSSSEEQKEEAAKTHQELKKEQIMQSESIHKRLAERRRRIALKNSMNSSVCSDMPGDG